MKNPLGWKIHKGKFTPTNATISITDAMRYGYYKCMCCQHLMDNKGLPEAESDGELRCSSCGSIRIQFHPPTID